MGAGRWGRVTRSGRWSCGASAWAVRGERRGVSWAERRVTGPRGVSGPSGERELGPRGIQLGQGLGLGLQGTWDWAAGLV